MGKPPRKPSAAAAMLGLGGHHRIDPDTLRSRVQDRERREASDTRTEAQRWLGGTGSISIGEQIAGT